MAPSPKHRLHTLLRWSEKYTKTDMVYLASGGFWLTSAQVVSSFSALALTIVFANFLDQSTFGIYRYVLSIFAILAIPVLPGMNAAITQAVARGNTGAVLPGMRTMMRWGLLTSLGGAVLGSYYFFFHNYPLAISFLMAGAFLPIMNSIGIYDSMLQGKKDFRRSTIYSALSQIAVTVGIAASVVLTKNLYLIVFAYLFGWTVVRYISLQLSLRRYPPDGPADPNALTYGKHLTAITILGSIVGYADRLIVFHFFGAASLAVYSIAVAPPDQARAVIRDLSSLALPKFSKRTYAEIQLRMPSRYLLAFLFGLTCAVLYIACAPFLFGIVFPKYAGSIFYSQLYAAVLLFVPASALLGNAFQSKPEFMNRMYVTNISTNAVLLILLLVLGYLYGIIGIIAARVFYNFFGLAAGMVAWNLPRKQSSA